MQFTTNTHEETPNATSHSWLAPLSVLIAWLVSLLRQIANLKRIRATTVFKPHWTESWADLRRLEWHRDQMLAQGAALLLAGKTLDEADAQLTDPPADYGGPRPHTPFQMQRRFLAIAEWLKDPEAMIRRHAARIAKRAGLDPSYPLVAHGSTDAALRAAAHHELVGVSSITESKVALMLSSARSARPSKHARGFANARAPPKRDNRLPTASARAARLRSPSHALRSPPSVRSGIPVPPLAQGPSAARRDSGSLRR